MPSICVSGAGNNAVNGTYTQSESVWVKDVNTSISYENDGGDRDFAWMLRYNGNLEYQNATGSATPTSSAWGTVYSTAPAPTVTDGACGTAPTPTPTPTPNTIRIKRSSTTTATPTSLLEGELAANILDKKLWIGNSSKTPVLISDYNNAGGSGTVTSVGLTVPTGLSVANSPVTTAASLNVTLTAGYSIPTTTSQGNWDTAYTQKGQWTGGSTSLVAATGRTSLGLVIGTNVQAWDADLDAIGAIAGTTGILKKTAANTWSLDTTAYTANAGTVTSVAALTLGTTGTDLSSTVATGTVTPVITLNVPTASATNRGALSSTDWSNFNTAYSNRITSLTKTGTGAATLTSNVLNIPTPATATFTSLTVTGSSGASTLSAGVLNVPTYTLSGLGGQALATNLTSLSGLTYVSASFVKMTALGTFSLDTTAYTANTGTVTSVGASVPTGLSISGSPITSSGTLAITLTAGYSIPTTASQTNWDSGYNQRLQWDGGATNLVAATARTSLGATTVGGNLLTLVNPSAVTFPRLNLDNTVSALDAATFRSAIGAGTSSTPILENLQTISTSRTLTAASNGTSLGPITINTSVTVALSNGQRWIIL